MMSKSDIKRSVLHTYFNGGPMSIDLIENNLYLGGLSAAKDVPTLTKCGITHILTLDTCPLPRYISEMKNLTTKFVQLSDQAKEDLISHLDDAVNFITDGIESGGTVLVHCYFGVSRSASVVIAYVMKKYQLPYPKAFEVVKLKRGVISPNSGFVIQLKLYQKMGFTLDKDNVQYKMFRLSMAAEKVKRVKILPKDCYDLIKPDPSIIQIQPEPSVYRCKKCRRTLASESNLIVHKDKSTDSNCTKIYFIEPLSWMDNVASSIQEKLYCPKCKNKVGSFSWVMGCKCPCGHQVAPAFYLTPSKIDFSDVVKNVEITL